jgi:hypothetical protein
MKLDSSSGVRVATLKEFTGHSERETHVIGCEHFDKPADFGSEN